MQRQLAFDAHKVVGFSPPGAEDSYVSRMLVDKQSVGSERLVVNHFTLRPGKSTPSGSHPAPYDELYYVLSGQGVLHLGDKPEVYHVTAGWVALIPGGTLHSLHNSGEQDLELLTVMPLPLVPGVNATYDARLAAWGASFRMVEE
jgi:mannose-6-phosphate isomerase-like protein (cupin superfamily)